MSVLFPNYMISSSDHRNYIMSEKALFQSITLGNCVSNLGYTPDKMHVFGAIPVPAVSSQTLSMIVQWCTKHQEDEPLKPWTRASFPMDRSVPEWDAKFLMVDNNALFDLLCAANYLEIRGLMDMICNTVAKMANGKTPQQIRDIFGIEPN